MFNVAENSVLTSALSNEVATIPAGARTIDIVNTGSTSITYIGNSPQGNIALTPVGIATSQAYSFGDTGKPYPSITVDCTGSSADISVVY
jgi:hypothetical protein